MRTTKLISAAAVPLLALGATLVPMQVTQTGQLSFDEVCAQTGTCRYNGLDICFVNGTGFVGYEWVGGE